MLQSSVMSGVLYVGNMYDVLYYMSIKDIYYIYIYYFNAIYHLMYNLNIIFTQLKSTSHIYNKLDCYP